MVGMVCLCLSNAEGLECLQISFLFCTFFPILLPTHDPHTLLSVPIQYEIPRAIIQPCILTHDREGPNNSTSDKVLTLLSLSGLITF